MKKILVIGIGSRIMMDDAIGIHIVEDLIKADANQNINYICGETDVDYCIDEVRGHEYVIVVDAFLSGKSTGEISVIPLNELDKWSEDSFYSMHGAHLLNMLQRAGHSPEGILIGIEPYEINYGFTLSSQLQSCYSRILEEVQEHIGKYIEQYGGR
jgi:hydrogenase maturation protease